MINTASAIIINADNKVLLQHRGTNAPRYPNTWSIWGGKIEEGETPMSAMIRELNEELAITVDENQLIFFKTYKNMESDDEKERHIFCLKDTGDFKYNLQEGDDFKFFSQAEIKTLNIVPKVGHILSDYFASQK